MPNSKTKVAVALGLLDIARQVTHAWAARRTAEQQRLGFGQGLREDARQVARGAREHMPWGHTPTVAERARTWGPVAAVVALSSAAVIVVAHLISRRDPQLRPETVATDSRVKGAIVAGSHAIDAGSTAVRQAAVQRAKVELDHRVMQPARHKALVYGSLGVLGLTVYVIIVAVIVVLVAGAIG